MQQTIMSEMRSNGFDPSNLHLRKELTAIRKAARVLRDPGTTSSWRSPLSSSRSVANVTAAERNNLKNPNLKFSETPNQRNGKEKEKQRVFLYNWKIQRSSSEKSTAAELPIKRGGEEDNNDDVSISGSGSTENTLSDARNEKDLKSDTYTGHHHHQRQQRGTNSSTIFRCRDTNVGSLVTPSMRRSLASRKKWKKNSHSASMLRNHYQNQQKSANFAVKNSKKLVDGTGRDDSSEEDYTFPSASSPLLSRLRKGNYWPPQSSSSKLLRKDDSSYTYNSTPALSTSSYNRYGLKKKPSTVGSWDGTNGSNTNNDDDHDHDHDQLDLPGSQGCGIPCYWSKKTPKDRGGGGGVSCGSCYSPSLSDTLKRKGSRILRSNQSLYDRRRSILKRSRNGVLPLLTNSCDSRGGIGSSLATGTSDDDDELSTNFGELDLEALSRLDGRRWSSCKSQEGLEIMSRGKRDGSPTESNSMKSLSQKYKPIFFDELIGQNIVVQSLVNAISKARIAPVYLFQGPRGTGKSSTARIFAAALNCISTEDPKPCGYCRECSNFVAGNSKYLKEIDGTNKKEIEKIRNFVKNMPTQSSSTYTSRYHVFVIDECHLIPLKTWLAFLKFLENPPARVVFIFITTDLDNLPRTVLSRCQKYIFNKIKDGDMVTRLRKIVSEENLEVESDALDLIVLNADGSLRDAETMLDQLSLLGKRITASLVNELVGIVSDEKLLELLELAMSSDTAETVKRSRELMDSGADPMVLMSQLASLIMDIIAGSSHTHPPNVATDAKFVGGHALSEGELDKLKHGLKLLSEAEKQVRVSSERSTWFTATLLQLGSVPSPDLTLSSSSRRQSSSKTTEEDPSSNTSTHCRVLSEFPTFTTNTTSINSEKLDDIWTKCIDVCHSTTLRQLLYTHAKLVSISQIQGGGLVACISFGNADIKSRAERFVSSITNSFEIVLKCNVQIKTILIPNPKTKSSKDDQEPLNTNHEGSERSSSSLGGRERKQAIPMKRIESIIREQRLESAWLQANTPEGSSLGRSKPEKNQVLPQDMSSFNTTNNILSTMKDGSIGVSSSHNWEDDLNHDLKVLKINEGKKDLSVKRSQHYPPMSPSLLHDVANFSNKGYESGSGTRRGCSGMFCWNNTKTHNRGEVKQQKAGGRFLWFGECVKSSSQKTGNRSRR